MFLKPIAKYLANINCILIYLYSLGNYTKNYLRNKTLFYQEISNINGKM